MTVDQRLINELMVHVEKSLRKFAKKTLRDHGPHYITGPIETFDEDSDRLLMKPRTITVINVQGHPIRVLFELRHFNTLDNAAGAFSLNKKAMASALMQLRKAMQDGPPQERFANARWHGLVDALRKEVRVIEKLESLGITGRLILYAFPSEISENLFSWRDVDFSSSIASMKETLAHELVHARDVYSDQTLGSLPLFRKTLPDQGKLASEWQEDLEDWRSSAKYANSKMENRAYMLGLALQVIPAVRQQLSDIAKVRRVTPQDQSDAVLQALEQTSHWRALDQYRSQKSKNLLLKGIVTALEDEGIITIE